MQRRDMRQVRGMVRFHEYARSLAKLVDIKADYFPGHGESVGYLLGIMAMEAGLHPEDRAMLHVFGLVHDAGKIMVPVNILNKPGALCDDEWTEMKAHPRHGELILRAAGMDDLATWVRHHHERFDGDGYPDGLIGDEIPWQSRWCLVADAANVMLSDRIYKAPLSRDQMRIEFEQNTGTQFCPEAIALLFGLSQLPEGAFSARA